MIGLLRQIESRVQGDSLMLVSHGDPLQILMTAAVGRALTRHRQMTPIGTGEIRVLQTSNDRRAVNS
jgi:probable phosphoglycerate mutase